MCKSYYQILTGLPIGLAVGDVVGSMLGDIVGLLLGTPVDKAICNFLQDVTVEVREEHFQAYVMIASHVFDALTGLAVGRWVGLLEGAMVGDMGGALVIDEIFSWMSN